MEDATLERVTQEVALKRKFKAIETREKYLFKKSSDQEEELKEIKSVLEDICRKFIYKERNGGDSFSLAGLSKPEQMNKIVVAEEEIRDAFNALRDEAESPKASSFPYELNETTQEIALEGLLLRSGWRLMGLHDNTGDIGKDFKKENLSLKIRNRINKETEGASKYLEITCWQNRVEERGFDIVNPENEVKMRVSINFRELPRTFQAMYGAFMYWGTLSIHPSKGFDFSLKLREED